MQSMLYLKKEADAQERRPERGIPNIVLESTGRAYAA